MSFIEHEIQYQRAPTPQQRTSETQYINEQGQHEDRKMSLNTLLNTTEAVCDQDDKGSIEDEELASQDISPSASPSPYSGGALIPIQSTPSPANTANRALCHICKSESGRCHASDPSTMQAFFANTLGFEGCLSTSDWLCMKCYSKWYNRCKRKAASSTTSLPSDGPSSSSKRRRRRDKDVFTKRERQPSSDGEKDTDSDDALLLARMGQYPHVYSPIHATAMQTSTNNSEDSRDSESEVELLREEVRSMKSEMARLVQQQAKRDEQMEGLLTFVKTEFSAMHDLFKELAEGRWVRPMPTPMPIPSGLPMTMPMPMQMQMPMPIPIREPPNLAARAQFAPKVEDARLCEA